ncbi:MAG: hypothetical protein IH984_12710 [Planctomycetes bacterium]|nr:hypothetical protein [Planctomycetota bacterium]
MVQVRVYSKANVFLGFITTPADPSGANFIGVWSPDPIGRINIYDPNSKPEGADNIQAWGEVLPCPWDLDSSGTVGTNDLLELFAQWGTAGPADFDGSGAVNTADLLILFANWGPCP